MRMLRTEAEAVKDCFTKFSFQTWVIAATAIGLILELQESSSFITYASIPVIVLVMHVHRIGIYKYTTANRLYGYELYISRRKRLQKNANGWEYYMARIGWEEASYAWRIIQPTIYSTFYKADERPHFSKKEELNEDIKSRDGGKNTIVSHKFNDDIVFYPGSYLKKSFIIGYLLCLALSLTFIPPLYYSIFSLIFLSPSTLEEFALLISFWECLGYFLGLVAAVTITLGRNRRINSKRELVESGIHSINSCAQVWHIVVLAHYRALNATAKQKQDNGIEGFYDHQGDRLYQPFPGSNLGEPVTISASYLRVATETTRF